MKKIVFGSILAVGALFFVGCGGDKGVEERVNQIQSNTQASEANVASTPADVNANAVSQQEPTKEAASAGVDGKAIFASKCAACHGQNGEGKGVYPKVAGLSKDDALKMLNGYVDGTYGKAQKMMMAGQAKALSDAQRVAVAEYIATLK